MTTQTKIIRAMRKSVAPEPPADFIQSIMQRLDTLPQRSFFCGALFRPCQIRLPGDNSIDRTPGTVAIFFLAAFGYLILSGILLMGFRRLGVSSAIPHQLLLQPWIILCFAAFFMLAGVVAMFRQPFPIRLLKIALLFFLVFSVSNGIMVQMALNTIFPAVGIALYSIVGLVVGMFLYSRIGVTA